MTDTPHPHTSEIITCPWCGTNYIDFQPNCNNCGGSMPPPPKTPQPEIEIFPAISDQTPPTPPPAAPRQIPRHYSLRILGTDTWAITAGILGSIGAIFFVVGFILTIAILTAFVGIPFLGLGLAFLGFGVPVLIWRYNYATKMVELLRDGQAALGQIVEVRENFNVQVNGRYPWTITYRFLANGRDYGGKVTTLSAPTMRQQPGKPAYVLYDPTDPQKNTLYPNPYGYLVI